jgi:hypothetical protein
MTGSTATKSVSVSLTGRQVITLIVNESSNGTIKRPRRLGRRPSAVHLVRRRPRVAHSGARSSSCSPMKVNRALVLRLLPDVAKKLAAKEKPMNVESLKRLSKALAVLAVAATIVSPIPNSARPRLQTRPRRSVPTEARRTVRHQRIRVVGACDGVVRGRLPAWRQLGDHRITDLVARPGREGYQMVYGVPIIPARAACRRGRDRRYNSHFTKLAQALDSHGQGQAILRLGWSSVAAGTRAVKSPQDAANSPRTGATSSRRCGRSLPDSVRLEPDLGLAERRPHARVSGRLLRQLHRHRHLRPVGSRTTPTPPPAGTTSRTRSGAASGIATSRTLTESR